MTNAGRRAVADLFDSTVPARYDDDDDNDKEPHRLHGFAHRLNGNGHRNGDRPRRSSAEHSANRWAMLNAFVDLTMRTASKPDHGVWFVLFRETKPNGIARISEKQIATLVGADERTVRRSIDRLRKAGLIEVVKRGGIGRGPSSYRVFGVPTSRK